MRTDRTSKAFKQLAKVLAEDDFREPYATRREAEAAALERTPRGERGGLELLRCAVPAGAYAKPDPDAPGVPGPLTWWDYGDPVEAAEEYGIEIDRVVLVATYDAKARRWTNEK